MEEVRLKLPPGRILFKEGRCPNGCSLINKDKTMSGQPALTAMVRLRGASSQIHLNPYYGVYEYECEAELQEGDIVDLYCPHCNVSLSVDEACRMCNVQMFAIHLPDGGEIRACPKVGCHNHHLTIVDLDSQIADYYTDEIRPKM